MEGTKTVCRHRGEEYQFVSGRHARDSLQINSCIVSGINMYVRLVLKCPGGNGMVRVREIRLLCAIVFRMFRATVIYALPVLPPSLTVRCSSSFTVFC